ncbi:MAG TPA: DUF2855 family protein [Solirubrobacterales bacterium]|nr:DUF2855 family protein [Solirubrobacterales bacterium]
MQSDAMGVNQTLEVQRQRIAEARIAEAPLEPLRDGEVRVRVERFALTANNITYGVIGEMLGYWEFFPPPADDAAAGWGRIPAMGWGEVVASEADGIEPGGRYYGWYPMSRWCTMTATATQAGFRDDGAHRSEHAPVYRAYLETSADPLHEPGADAEDRHALLRGLFGTAYVADEFFAARDYFGASTVIVLSASSKTAIGFAQRAARRGLGEVVGLTSDRNREFVEGLGFYDRVLTYGAEDELTESDSVLIDMAGNGEILQRVHTHLGDRLKHSMIVGMSHHDAPRGEVEGGPQPEMFFAPAEIKQLSDVLGREEFQRRLAEATGGLISASADWLTLERSSGSEQALDAYRSVLEGSTPPSVGRIVSLH